MSDAAGLPELAAIVPERLAPAAVVHRGDIVLVRPERALSILEFTAIRAQLDAATAAYGVIFIVLNGVDVVQASESL